MEKVNETKYFTFGQAHIHRCNGKILDRDTVVKITAENPRERMVDLFGNKWAFEYDTLEDIHIEYYPKGIVEL